MTTKTASKDKKNLFKFKRNGFLHCSCSEAENVFSLLLKYGVLRKKGLGEFLFLTERPQSQIVRGKVCYIHSSVEDRLTAADLETWT